MVVAMKQVPQWQCILARSDSPCELIPLLHFFPFNLQVWEATSRAAGGIPVGVI